MQRGSSWSCLFSGRAWECKAQIYLFLSPILTNSLSIETECFLVYTAKGRRIPVGDSLLSSQFCFLISLKISFLLCYLLLLACNCLKSRKPLSLVIAQVTIAGTGTPCSRNAAINSLVLGTSRRETCKRSKQNTALVN